MCDEVGGRVCLAISFRIIYYLQKLGNNYQDKRLEDISNFLLHKYYNDSIYFPGIFIKIRNYETIKISKTAAS